MQKAHKNNRGQVLITLLFFSIFAITIISASIVANITTSDATSSIEQGVLARSVAESGAENALLRLLRNPSYTGETLTVGTGTATITVAGSNPATITSKGVSGNYIKTIQVIISYTNGMISITSWKEI